MSGIRLTSTSSGSLPTPPTGKVIVFHDTVGGELKTLDSAGVSSSVGSSAVEVRLTGAQVSAAATSLNFTGGIVDVTGSGGVLDVVITGDGTGDVVGPATSFVNMVPVFDSSTGKLLATSSLVLAFDSNFGIPILSGADGAMALRGSDLIFSGGRGGIYMPAGPAGGAAVGINNFDWSTGDVFTPLGPDVSFYVSGSRNSKDSATGQVSLFEGDLVVSGAAHFGVTSSRLIIQDLSLAPGFSDSGVVLRNSAIGSVITAISCSQLQAIGTAATTIAGGTVLQLISPTQQFFFLGNTSNLPGWDQPAEGRLRHFSFFDTNIGDGSAPLEGTATDVMFFVSGAVGGRNADSGSISLFGGDVHISGNLTVSGTSPGGGGGVAGPSTSVINQVPVFGDTTGDSVVTSSLHVKPLGTGVEISASNSLLVRGGGGLILTGSGDLAVHISKGGGNSPVAINNVTDALAPKETVGTDVGFFVSGTQTRGAASDSTVVFNGHTVISGGLQVSPTKTSASIELGTSGSFEFSSNGPGGALNLRPLRGGGTTRGVSILDNGGIFTHITASEILQLKSSGLCVISGAAGPFPGGGTMLSCEGGTGAGGGIVSVNNVSLAAGPLEAPGADVKFFVSGTKTAGSLGDSVSLFEGAVHMSGGLVVEQTLRTAPDSVGGHLQITSQLIDPDLQTISGSQTIFLHSEAEMFVSGGADGLGLHSHGVLSLQNMIEGPSFVVDVSALGTDVSLFVSGTVSSGSASDRVVVHNGSTVISGNLEVKGNLQAGSGIKQLTSTAVKSATYVAVVDERVLINPEDGSTVVVSGAASPATDDLWAVKNVTTSSHEFFIQGNGNTVEAPSGVLTASFSLSGSAASKLASLEWFYNSGLSTWFLK